MNKLPLFHKGKSGGMHFNKRQELSLSVFLFGYLGCILVIFLIIFLRLFQLTLVKGDYFRRLSEQNRIRELPIESKRGTIFDRKGTTIAESLPADIHNSSLRLESPRFYRASEPIAHLVGYRQKADTEELLHDVCLNKLTLGDKVGKKGVEKIFDCSLRGRFGKKLVEINAKGNFIKTLTILPPSEGSSLKLAMDIELQKIAYELIKDQKAAVIGIQPKTGEVLILVSTPSFNPQIFEDEITEVAKTYIKDDKKPLFNRTTEGTYPPGSVFKLVVASAALEERKITSSTLIEDKGIIQAGPLTFGNWYFLQYGKTEGQVDVIKAIQRSNDIFFYKTGEFLGPLKMKQWSEQFGLGKKTGIGLNEEEGLVPSEFWKEETFHDHWYLGDTYNLSIGQGYIITTPLQIAQTTAVFANGGYLCQPQLLRGEKKCKKLPISQKTLGLVKEGMKRACSTGGTGWPFFQFSVISDHQSVISNQYSVFSKKQKTEKLTTDNRQATTNIQVACKTGTAESHAKSGKPHAWFTVFAPYDNPEIVLTVLIEEGGQGADAAAPIAKEILKTYFERIE